MRARPAPPALAPIARQIEMSVGIEQVRALNEGFAAATPDMIAAILDEAARFAERYLVPLNEQADRQGCQIVDGRVYTAPGHRDAWEAFVEAGWGTLDAPPTLGGQGLPLALAAVVQEIFDRACPAFGMLPVPQRSATKLIAAFGDPAIQAEWLPRLVTGEWGATICISEVEAGSDAGRIRTRAVRQDDGNWAITGEKCWISFGDHDLTSRIGHCLLARTPDAPPGGAGLSLFLVPSRHDDGAPNAIVVRRIEEKLGLHGAPTCALGFEGARGRILGQEGRGLAQMFVMITNMRLAVGLQGLGIASAAADTALGYARERRQGGPVDAPVPIIAHADVQRQLLGQAARVEVLRGLALAVANQADLAAHHPDAEVRADAMALVQWLLPILKTSGGELASQNADAAIQILGGAGYTRDWPVEQALRDARVLTIFEGTTGIQALDLLYRRLLRPERRGYDVFLRMARGQVGDARLPRCLDILEATSRGLLDRADDTHALDGGATAFLHLAALAATGWIAGRLTDIDGDDAAARRLRAAGRHWLSDIDDRAAMLSAQCLNGAAALAIFAGLTAE